MVRKITSVIALALVWFGYSAHAADAPFEVSGNVTLTSDYSFRGVSQTTRDPAIQGGFDIETEVGVYVGTWGSNVNFGDGVDASMELDLYVGWGTDLGDGDWSVDVNYVRFEYPSSGSDLDYNEFGGSVSYKDVTVGLIYSNEYFAVEDLEWYYPYAQYSLGLPNDLALDFHIGFSNADFGILGDEDKYIDYSVVLTVPVAGVDLGLGVYGTDIDKDVCNKACEGRFIASISKSL